MILYPADQIAFAVVALWSTVWNEASEAVTTEGLNVDYLFTELSQKLYPSGQGEKNRLGQIPFVEGLRAKQQSSLTTLEEIPELAEIAGIVISVATQLSASLDLQNFQPGFVANIPGDLSRVDAFEGSYIAKHTTAKPTRFEEEMYIKNKLAERIKDTFGGLLSILRDGYVSLTKGGEADADINDAESSELKDWKELLRQDDNFFKYIREELIKKTEYYEPKRIKAIKNDTPEQIERYKMQMVDMLSEKLSRLYNFYNKGVISKEALLLVLQLEPLPIGSESSLRAIIFDSIVNY